MRLPIRRDRPHQSLSPGRARRPRPRKVYCNALAFRRRSASALRSAPRLKWGFSPRGRKGPMSEINDHDLGMHRAITRRDFLNGVAVAAGATFLPTTLLADTDPEKSPNYYPPALSGLRGSHVGAFEALHSLRDGNFWDTAGKPEDTGEDYDLIVVGGGISGLSSAYYFQRAAGGKAKILILENHDDFGGHAKRNEFTAGGRKMLGYGGAFSIESPAPYSAVAKAMIADLGIDVSSYSKYVHKEIYRSQGLTPHIFFDKETFGADKLVIDPHPLGGSETGDLSVNATDPWKSFLAEAPIPEKARQDIFNLFHDKKDFLPGLTSTEKKTRLARMSYAKFLTDLVGVSPEVIQLFQAEPNAFFGLGIDAVPAQDCWGLGYPGFQGMNLDPAQAQAKTATQSAARKPRATSFTSPTATPPSPASSYASSFPRQFPGVQRPMSSQHGPTMPSSTMLAPM